MSAETYGSVRLCLVAAWKATAAVAACRPYGEISRSQEWVWRTREVWEHLTEDYSYYSKQL